MGADNRKDFIFRTGTFFVLIGIGLIILFGASIFTPNDANNDAGSSTNNRTVESLENPANNSVPLFFAGLISLAFGWYLKRITAPPPTAPSGRFGGLHKMLDRRKKGKK